MNKVKSIHFKGYKSFSEDNYNEFNEIKNVNVIIGKNNSGKSSVIDILEYIIDFEKFKINRKSSQIIEIGFNITEQEISKVFPEGTWGGGIPGNNHYEFGKQFIGKYIRSKLFYRGNNFPEYVYSENQNGIFKIDFKKYWDDLAGRYTSFFNEYKFRRLNSERNITPEQKNPQQHELLFNGEGATRLICQFITSSSYDEKLIEEILLSELNKIMAPDSIFTAIQIQEIDGVHWEIFLKEKDSKRFPLSQSGSGLKTIILVLLNLLVIPETKEYKGKRIVFAFEELENNLHPALQRRLFKYIYDYAVEKDVSIFLTTHSHVAINVFANKDKAQIVHVVKENNISTMKTISNHTDKIKILDDLDIRASDLFQSNGIIWVEGPSDRIYIKKWLEVFCDCKYEEGYHYQFLYYGGKLLAHYTTEDEKADVNGTINILTTNHNSAIIMDSDKKTETASIGETKKRVKQEFENNKLFYWITKGKEIENYISFSNIEKVFGKTGLQQCGQYELFPEYVNDIYGSFSCRKVDFAKKMKDFITSANVLDLKENIEELYKQIASWNKD
ncbi:MAG: ATP-binding protein [Endomicrobiaceae bacterium]|nr:ATP-binding protein [Endomicrobiaceae bacterium]